MGKGTAVKWPAGLGGKGNEGVTALVEQSPGGIGYVELIYAAQNKLPYAEIESHGGEWVKPSVETVTAAASGAAANIPSDFRVSITDAPGANAYPISSFTYLLVYQQQTDAAKGKAIKDFIKWMLKDGQHYAPALSYAPLPAPVVSRRDRPTRQGCGLRRLSAPISIARPRANPEAFRMESGMTDKSPGR